MSDWIPSNELTELTGVPRRTLYNQHSTRTGALAPILTKFGGRLGAWRADYEVWKDAQRKLKPPPSAASLPSLRTCDAAPVGFSRAEINAMGARKPRSPG